VVVVGTRSGGWVTVGTGTGELDGGDIVVVVGEVGLGPPLPGGVEVDDEDGWVVRDVVVADGMPLGPPVVVAAFGGLGPADERRGVGIFGPGVLGEVAAPDSDGGGDGGPPRVRVVGGGWGRPRSSWPWLAA
jgi:hypothetical protein